MNLPEISILPGFMFSLYQPFVFWHLEVVAVKHLPLRARGQGRQVLFLQVRRLVLPALLQFCLVKANN